MSYKLVGMQECRKTSNVDKLDCRKLGMQKMILMTGTHLVGMMAL